MRTLLVALIGGLVTALTTGAVIIGIGFEPVSSLQMPSGASAQHVTIAAMTDGLGRNRGTRPNHPRASCRCN